MKVHIIGAGIAGLCAAIGLKRIGCEVIVSERADAIREVGAGISLWSNAMRCLDALGVGNLVRPSAQAARVAEVRVNNGHRRISRFELAIREHEKSEPPTFSMIHRAELVAALAKAISPSIFRWKQTLSEVQSFEDQVTAEFADGSRVMSNILIGADGIHSVVRRHILGSCRPRYAGYTCYRGVCEAPPSLVPTGYVSETWGRGLRFGVTSLTDNRVYWWATRPAPSDESEKYPRENLIKLFKDWAPPIPQLLKSTAAQAVLRNDILDHEPHLPWHRGRVAMVGDAAHAVTPNFGQGGCLAIEDAVVLARMLRPLVETHRKLGSAANTTEIEKAFAAYAATRFDRCKWLNKRSNQLGRIGQWSRWWQVGPRNFVMGLTPPGLLWNLMLKPTRFDVGQI